ncbi:MAG: hypothetical protein KC588_00940 [Nitrospira sp.]|nr:hypothetical protein [Nitrospira sp.]
MTTFGISGNKNPIADLEIKRGNPVSKPYGICTPECAIDDERNRDIEVPAAAGSWAEVGVAGPLKRAKMVNMPAKAFFQYSSSLFQNQKIV